MMPKKRAAPRPKPCKKQRPPFFPQNTSQRPMEPSTNRNSDNSHSKSTVSDYSCVNQQYPLCTPKRHSMSRIIKSTLKSSNKRVYHATLAPTSKSLKVQSKMSAYFTSIARSINNNTQHVCHPPTNYAESQHHFQTKSNIGFTKNYSQSESTSLSKNSLASSRVSFPETSSPSTKSKCASPIKYLQDASDHSSISSHASVERLFVMDEFQYSCEESRHSSSSLSSNSLSSSSAYLPTDSPTTGQIPSTRRMRSTTSRNLRPSQVQTIHPSQQTTFSSAHELSSVPSPTPQEIQTTLKSYIQEIRNEHESYESLQKEYNARQAYIDSQIQSLSTSVHPPSPEACAQSIPFEHSLQLLQRLTSHVSSPSPLSSSTSPPPKPPVHSAFSATPRIRPPHWDSSSSSSSSLSRGSLPNNSLAVTEDAKVHQMKAPFKHLNYAGAFDSDSKRTDITSEVSMSASSWTNCIEELSLSQPEPTISTTEAPEHHIPLLHQSMLSLPSVPSTQSRFSHSASFSLQTDAASALTNQSKNLHPMNMSISVPQAPSLPSFDASDTHPSMDSSDHASQSSHESSSSPVPNKSSIPSAILNVPTPSHPNVVTLSNLVHEDPLIKSKDSIRIIGQNSNGISREQDDKGDMFMSCMSSFLKYNPDVLLLSETNTDWYVHDNFYITKLRTQAVWSPSPTKTIVTSCKWTNTNKTSYQPGGVMTVLLNHMPSRIKTVTRDTYGRYIKTVFQAKQKRIAIYNVYRTNPMHLGTAGIDTCWMQQWRLFRIKNPKIDPRRKCIEDLITEIQKGYEDDEYPILMGDFNEDMHKDKGFGILDLMRTCSLCQIYLETHGTIPSSRNNHRSVFHAFVSKHISHLVERLGILPHTEGFHKSDHIPFFVDFKKELLSHVDSPILSPDHRKLKTHDSINIEKYNCYVKDQFDQHNILQRTLNLREYIKEFSFNQIARQELEKIDSQVTNIRLRSEQRLTPDPSKFRHTSKMDKLVHQIRILQSISKLENNKKDASNLRNYIKSIDIEEDISTPSTLKIVLSNKKKDLKFMHSEADVLREDHLDQCIEKASEIHDKKKISIIKQIQEREKQKRSWSKIQFAVSKNNGYGVGRLGIPAGMDNASTEEIWRYLSDHTNTPTWTFVTDPDEIDRRLWEWQYLHYNQAYETPMATSQWHSKLDPQNKTDSDMEEIMNGNIFSESDLPKEAKLFFQHLTSNIQPPLDPSKIEINKEVFQSFYKGARESTSSSPSKLHLGHWKAASYDDDISTVLSMIIQIAVANEYPLRRWQTVISVLLEKMSGKPYLHKFRTIHLVESDFNFVLRYIWGKQFMRHNISTLHANQYGGRSGIQGQSAALNKTLTMDIIRYYGEPAALIDNDAQACYDRLIPVVLSYALIRLGLPPHLTRFMCKWLENSEYYLKLSHGLSKHSYSTTLDKYLFGTGQGTGWSPPNWSAISDIISNAMEENTPGMFLQHPNNVTFSSRSYDAFVDDVNGGLTQDGMKIYHPPTSFSVPLLNTIFSQIQANIQFYARLLFTSGGKLALHKCYCYILEFEWKSGKKSMVQTANKYPPLQIDQTFQNKPNQITLLNPSIARKMLGAVAAPDGSTKAQFEALYTKARHWGQKIKTSYLNRYDATMSLRQGILKSLEYPLGVSLLSAQQCYDILVPVLTPYLNKIGVNSKTPRTIVHGPIEHAGFQIPDLYTSQGMQKIQLLLGHTRKQDATGKILNIAMAIAQQEVGITIPILEASYKKYNFLLSHSWIKCMWLFLYQIEATIVVPDIWTPSPCYANDVNIMEQIIKWDLPKEKIEAINLSRLYMKVYFVGELLDTSRTRLKNDIRLFRPNNYHNDKFPSIPKLPKRFQEIWTYTINRLVSETPLGNFLGSLHSALSIEWSISKSMLYLIRTQKNNKLVYGRIVDSTNKIMFSSTSLASSPSVSPAYAVTVTSMPHSLRVQHPISLPSPPPSPPVYAVYPLGLGAISSPTSALEIETFQQRLDSMSPAYQSMVGQIQSISYVQEIALAIHRKQAIGVGDASVASSRGGHAYILETKPARFHLHGIAPVHCVEEDITSNRSEGITVLAMLILVHQICLQYQIKEGEITIYCDNAEALRRKHAPTCTYTKLSSRDDDVKMELYYLLQKIPIQVHLCHVSGHADSDPDFDYDSAPQQVQRNIDMHNAVTAFMKNHPPHLKPTSNTTFLPNQKAGIYIQGQLITGNLKHHVLLQRHAHSLETRLSTHLGVPSKFQHVIDWKGLHLAMKNKNPAEKINICKIIHGLWPTATALECRGKGHSNVCIRCNLAAETPQHVYQCSSRMAKAAFRESIQGFRKNLKKMKVANPLINIFVEFFLAHHEHRKPKMPTYSFGNKLAFSFLKRAFSHQLLLETNVFHLGYISYKWSVVHRHYQDRDSKSEHMSDADVSWSAKLIAAIWTCSHSIWSKRCAQIHKKDKTADESLCSEELKSSIRSYLRLPRHDLSSEEKVLHLNVSRHLCKAYHTTLARWLHLLATERAQTIQMKRKDRIESGGLQPLTNFFRLNASRKVGNLAS